MREQKYLIIFFLLFQWLYLDFNNMTSFNLTQLFNSEKPDSQQTFTLNSFSPIYDLSHNLINEIASSLSMCNENHGLYVYKYFMSNIYNQFQTK